MATVDRTKLRSHLDFVRILEDDLGDFDAFIAVVAGRYLAS